MPSVFQLLDTLRNKLDCTLWDLRRQLRPSLRTSEIRLRRTVRTDFLLRVPAALVLVICAAAGVRCRGPSQPTPAAAEEYKVGPGRPPREYQFKPGQSGNPKGAKRKPPTLLPDLKRLF